MSNEYLCTTFVYFLFLKIWTFVRYSFMHFKVFLYLSAMLISLWATEISTDEWIITHVRTWRLYIGIHSFNSCKYSLDDIQVRCKTVHILNIFKHKGVHILCTLLLYCAIYIEDSFVKRFWLPRKQRKTAKHSMIFHKLLNHCCKFPANW